MQTLLARPSETVTDLGLAAALPRVPPAMARMSRRLYSGSAALDLVLRGRDARLRWEAPLADFAEHDSYCFRLGAHAGRVGLDLPGVCSLLDEPRSERLPRELRYVLWADTLHAVADAVAEATRLRFEWVPPESQERTLPDAQRSVFFALRSSGDDRAWRGFVEFDAAEALESLIPSWPAATRASSRTFGWLRLPLPFLLGTTQITLREMRGVCPGDIIGIEGWAASGSALLVTAQFGGARGPQLAGLAEGSRIVVQHVKELTMNREIAAASAAPFDGDAGQLPLDRLDALEVSLRFEVGELTLSLGELRSIRAGHVFELSQPLNRSPVRILAHGNVLGKGHLVAVGDRLGVRVSEFAPSEL